VRAADLRAECRRYRRREQREQQTCEQNVEDTGDIRQLETARRLLLYTHVTYCNLPAAHGHRAADLCLWGVQNIPCIFDCGSWETHHPKFGVRGTLMHIVPQILSFFRISSTRLRALQCSKVPPKLAVMAVSQISTKITHCTRSLHIFNV